MAVITPGVSAPHPTLLKYSVVQRSGTWLASIVVKTPLDAVPGVAPGMHGIVKESVVAGGKSLQGG